jgi:hypothetical protein
MRTLPLVLIMQVYKTTTWIKCVNLNRFKRSVRYMCHLLCIRNLQFTTVHISASRYSHKNCRSFPCTVLTEWTRPVFSARSVLYSYHNIEIVSSLFCLPDTQYSVQVNFFPVLCTETSLYILRSRMVRSCKGRRFVLWSSSLWHRLIWRLLIEAALRAMA